MSGVVVERNARIEGTMLGLEDHGIFTAFVYLDYGGLKQGFGGYCIKASGKNVDHANYAGHFIARVLEVVGVEQWEHLKGKTCRVRADFGKVHAIGHYLLDKWFCPSDELSKLAVNVGDEKEAK